MARIIWIEDDYQRIDSLVRLLELDGHEVLRYGSWESVQNDIDKVCASQAIILDIILPEIEEDKYMGLSVLHWLRENKYEGPVVVCSRVQNPDVLRRLKELGVSDILRKPVRPSELNHVVTRAMALHSG